MKDDGFKDYMKKKGNWEFCKFLEDRQANLGFTDEQMANFLDMPIYQYKPLKEGYLTTPTQKLLHQIATRLNMRFEELRKIAEKKYW